MLDRPLNTNLFEHIWLSSKLYALCFLLRVKTSKMKPLLTFSPIFQFFSPYFQLRRPQLFLLFQKLLTCKAVYLLIRFSKTMPFLWNTKNTSFFRTTSYLTNQLPFYEKFWHPLHFWKNFEDSNPQWGESGRSSPVGSYIYFTCFWFSILYFFFPLATYLLQ